jgi:hypothetical protein
MFAFSRVGFFYDCFIFLVQVDFANIPIVDFGDVKSAVVGLPEFLFCFFQLISAFGAFRSI